MTLAGRVSFAAAAVTGAVLLAIVPSAQTPLCNVPNANPVVCENLKTGNPASEWDVDGAGDESIQGFATDISVNKGQTIQFKVDTDASSYQLKIYRLGYYAGKGARLVATIAPSAPLPQLQPSCLDDDATGLIDCGNWNVSASWTVPSDATSGVYIVKLIRPDTGASSHMVFIVRDDNGHSSLLFQTSDTTWQAYNNYGGNSLYVGAPVGRAYKVSYNRPFATRTAQDGLGNLTFVFGSEYPMIRWLESNGYDVSYSTGVDSDRRGAELLEHKVFMSVGHDEYWSGTQRAAVETARNAGVHLAFFSGNEIFWKTRWENSTDASSTPYRTLVSYKETHANAKIDPEPVWTGTWRDPRFSPPYDGNRPENALSGTIFAVNCCPDDPISISSQEGKLRFWRNTSIASLPANGSATVPGILGHEWDISPDDASRPPGLIALSTTTTSVGTYLVDYGSNYGPGTATHHLTMYKHASGAIVFSAGTIQWPWSLDSNHDGGTSALVDLRIQQATTNLFADMTVFPASPQPGLVLTTASADTTAPVTIINTPTAGQAISVGGTVTVAGTVSDTGGLVAGVEVSVDNGASWHQVSGRSSWSYSWIPGANGTVTIRARAVDDSANLESPGAAVTVTVAPRTCPCSLWSGTAAPTAIDSGDPAPYELGIKFTSTVDGFINGVRFYKSVANTGTHVGHLWSSDGTKLAEATFIGETASGWQQVSFANPVPIVAGVTYTASYYDPNGHYSGDSTYFATGGILNAPLQAPGVGNGVFKPGTSGFPNQTYNSSNYWVDVVFTNGGPDVTPPHVLSVTPAAGATGVSGGVSPRATFDESLSSSTVTSSNVQLRQGNASGPLVPSSPSFNTSTHELSVDPTATLQVATTYTVIIQGGPTGVADVAGNRLANTYSWSFTTGSGICPCSIWAPTATPTAIDSGDPTAYELGVRFRSDSDGFVAAVRFYKSAANTGTHVGHLWSADGTKLAEATFTNETASGWQQVTFANPIPIAAGATYTASYYDPQGHYAGDLGYFSTTGVSNSPLSAPGGSGEPNGVFKSGASGFPDQAFNASNYWVDVVFTSSTTDTTTPHVLSVTPAASSTDAAIGTNVSATFDEALAPSTVNSTTVQLRRGAGGPVVPAAIAFNDMTRQLTIDPTNDLEYDVTYVATILGGSSGVSDLVGNRLATTYTWSFATRAHAVCPCSLWDSTAAPQLVDTGDPVPYELGIRFQPIEAGRVLGVRFHKAVLNTGVHTGSLWAPDGSLLAQATFTNETASGWQEVLFATPVTVQAGLTYTASYYDPRGHYSSTPDYFSAQSVENTPLRAPGASEGPNGVFRTGAAGFPNESFNASNYWVDVLFVTNTTDATPPTVAAKVPAAGATGVLPDAEISAGFSEPMDPASLALTLTGPGGVTVPGTIDYRANRTARFVPASSLQLGATYTASIPGGASGVRDIAGNRLATTATWTFTVTDGVTCPCSLWPASTVPATADNDDPSAYELGVRFTADRAGEITAIRFYKSAANAGPHTVNLWNASGTLLASAVSGTETASGWQQVALSTPVPVTAGTQYVASYFVPAGHYAGDSEYFLTQAVKSWPLRAPGAAESPNGVFRAGASGFPDQSFNGSNYWVDVVYTSNATSVGRTISIADRSIGEGNSGTTAAAVTLTLSSSSTSPVTVAWSTANGTATAGSDYTASSGTATFAPGTTTTTVSIPIVGDTAVEPNETFVVNLSSPTNATINDNQATITILNDDAPLPTISIDDLSKTEGNSGTSNAVVTLRLSASSTSVVTVQYATANGTATAGSDYTAASGTATFAAGATTTTINVPVAGDLTVEANETFVVNLTSPVNATISDAQATVTITNDDVAPPTISIDDLSIAEGNSGTSNAVVTLRLSASSTSVVTVQYATANGTAGAGDYSSRSGTATFAAGATTTTVSIPVAGDTAIEANETFVVNLTSPVNATIADAQATVTIMNDDFPALTVGNRTVTEGNSGTVNAAFTVTLSPASTSTVTVQYTTADGTASSATDYTATSGTLTFSPGATTQTINVPVRGDTLDEADETFAVNLSSPVNAVLGSPAAGTGTITDDDASPSLSVNNVNVNEGNSGTTLATLTVTLSAASGRTVTVNYATSNGTATTAADDYVAASGTLTFTPGTTTRQVSVSVNGDVMDENDETVNLGLSSASNATIADSTGVVTIVDDDAAPTISIDNLTVTEPFLFPANATFTVRLSAASGKTVTVNYATADGTAKAGSDYTAKTGSVTFAPGATTATFTVTIQGNLASEPTETFVVNLSGAGNGTIADNQAVCTILDN